MFVPFIYTLWSPDDDFVFWFWYYFYANECIKHDWPLISHERYIKRFTDDDKQTSFGWDLRYSLGIYCDDYLISAENLRSLRKYPILQEDENSLIAKYETQAACNDDLLENSVYEFEIIIGNLIDKIIIDCGMPEAILVLEMMPKALFTAANKRGIPVVIQYGGSFRPPFISSLRNRDGLCFIDTMGGEYLSGRYDEFKDCLQKQKPQFRILSRKGLIRLFIAEKFMKDVHNVDIEPEYDIGVLESTFNGVAHYNGSGYISDSDLGSAAKQRYNKVLIRPRPENNCTGDDFDNSPTCFHFACKCERVVTNLRWPTLSRQIFGGIKGGWQTPFV